MSIEWHPKLNGRGWSLGGDSLFPVEVADVAASSPSGSSAPEPAFAAGLLPRWYLGDLSKLPVGLREGMRKLEELSVRATFLSFAHLGGMPILRRYNVDCVIGPQQLSDALMASEEAGKIMRRSYIIYLNACVLVLKPSVVENIAIVVGPASPARRRSLHILRT